MITLDLRDRASMECYIASKVVEVVEISMASSVAAPQRSDGVDMSEKQVQTMIEKEAQALGLTADDAISRVKRGEIGEDFLWRDLASLVYLLYE
ncbi:MAG TPA: hypothetical protein VFB04_00795 [Terriglobales bacterium]|nr:hypothetical protein [Terriglobales bacterium]